MDLNCKKRTEQIRGIAIFMVWLIVLFCFFGGSYRKKAAVEPSGLMQISEVNETLVSRIQAYGEARQDTLNCLELRLGTLQPVYQTIELSVQNEDGKIIFHSTKKLSPEDQNSVVSFAANLPLEKGAEYVFCIDTQEGAQIAVGQGMQEYGWDGTVLLDGQPAQNTLIRARYLQPVSTIEVCAYAVLFFVYGTLATALIWFMGDIRRYVAGVYIRYVRADDWSTKAYAWWGLALLMELAAICFTFHYTLENVMDDPFVWTVAVAGGLCTAVVPKAYDQVRRRYGKAGIAVGWGISFYAAFALCGNYLSIYPVGRSIDFASVLQFLICWLWVAPFIFCALCFLECRRPQPHRNKNMPVSLTVLLIVIVVLPVCFVLLGANPAISTTDSATCLAQGAHQVYGLENWHPPIYILCLAVLVKIWDSTYMIVLAQTVVFLWPWCRLCGLLYKKGMRPTGIILATIFIAAIPSTPVLLCTIWKDVPYGCLLLLLTVLAMEYTELPEKRKNPLFLLEVAVTLTGVALIRANGIVPFVMMIAAIAAIKKLGRMRFVAVALSVLLIGVIVGPVYRYIDVQPVAEDNSGGAYIGLVHDILGVYHSGGTISQNTMALLEEVSEGRLQSGSYTPYRFWAYKMAYSGSVGSVITAYLDTFVHNPVRMVQQVACRTDGVWNIAAAKGAPRVLNLSGCMDETGVEPWQDYYPRRVENSFTAQVEKYASDNIAYTLKGVIVWRVGVWTLLSALCVAFWRLRRQPWWKMLVFVPLVGHIFSLLLSTGWDDQRYFWPIQMMSFAIFLLTLVNGPLSSNDKKEEYEYDF